MNIHSVNLKEGAFLLKRGVGNQVLAENEEGKIVRVRSDIPLTVSAVAERRVDDVFKSAQYVFRDDCLEIYFRGRLLGGGGCQSTRAVSFGREMKTYRSAILNGDAQTVARMVNSNIQLLNIKLPDGVYPLELAINVRASSVAEWMLEKGADINLISDSESFGLLGIAANNQMLRVCELLVSLGAKINNQKIAHGIKPFTPLYAACTKANTYYIKRFLELGADPNIVASGSGYTPLIVLANIREAGRKEMELLIEAGARLNDVDDGGRTALFYAVVMGRLDKVAVLCESGADMEKLPPDVACLEDVSTNVEVEKYLRNFNNRY